MEGKIFSFVNSLCFSVFQKGSYGLKVHVTYFGWCWQAGGWQVGQTSNGKVAGSSPRLYNPVWLDMWIAGINVRLNSYYIIQILPCGYICIVDYFPGKKITARDEFEFEGGNISTDIICFTVLKVK